MSGTYLFKVSSTVQASLRDSVSSIHLDYLKKAELLRETKVVDHANIVYNIEIVRG